MKTLKNLQLQLFAGLAKIGENKRLYQAISGETPPAAEAPEAPKKETPSKKELKKFEKDLNRAEKELKKS